MDQHNQIKIIFGTFIAGYLTASFNMINFAMGCTTTYLVMKYGSSIEIPIDIKKFYQEKMSTF